MGLTDEIKLSYLHGSYLTKLIYINIAIWVAVRIAAVFILLGGNEELTFIDWLALPASLSQFLIRPWTLLTYMFLHYDLWHILFNMLWLYSFGRILLEYHPPKKLLGLYIFGGIWGALFFMLAFHLFPYFQKSIAVSSLLGASASVIAIVVATAVYAPNHVVHLILVGPVRIKWIALVSVLLYVVNLTGDNAGGNFAHLGGAFWGMLSMTLCKSGRDLSAFPERHIDRWFSWRRPKKKLKVEYKSHDYREYGYNKSRKEKQEEVNRILDKISASGYESLTADEKEMLFRMSGRK
ncbi:MAG: rhomboid family intramembrane serine protease [Marinilabiliales bacterium]|nr:rhomboid family intramembrane serine protease [Marinilabiliales bacterium]